MIGRAMKAALVVLYAVGCQAPGRPPTHYRAGAASMTTTEATVTIVSLAPPRDTPLTRDSVLVADVHYEIRGFRNGGEYFFVPLFEKRGGKGTFNQLPNLEDGVRLKTASGDLRLKYAIHAEWDSARLNHPVRVLFVILERTELRHATSVGISEEFVYSRE